MRVLSHPDPFALEEELAARVMTARDGDPLALVLVLVPTVRLVAHVQRRLAEALGACLGVEVLHHRALVLRILDRSPGRAVRPASRRLREALLLRALEGVGDNLWAGYVRDRPGAAAPLLRALDDLREAGISPAEAKRTMRGGRRGDLATLFTAYSRELEVRGRLGLTDEAGLVRAALPEAAAAGERYRAILHHGAYELIGVHLELVKELDRGGRVTFLLPARSGAPAYAYAERFARRHLLADGDSIGEIDRPGRAAIRDGLAQLYEEAARPRPLEPGTIVLRHAQGAHGEVGAAVRGALAAVGDGIPPTETALVARTLTPYGSALEEAMELPTSLGEEGNGGIPWTTTLGTPLRRQPAVREVMLLLRAAAEGWPRGITAELLQSRRIRWQPLLGGDLPRRGEKVESWSRRAGVVGGVAEWTEDLQAWASTPRHSREANEEQKENARKRAEKDGREAAEIGRAVKMLSRRLGAERASSWSKHAAAVEKIVDEVLPGLQGAAPSEPLDLFLGLVEEMRSLETQIGDDRRIPFQDMVTWLEAAVDSEELRHPTDNGGLRVLDAMQARGLTFRRVFLFGFQSGLFPRPPREDPILPDDMRRSLREATGRPLTVKSEGDEEERLLLALMLGAAGERLEILWQRSDEQGRPRTPSLALREVARLMLGTPDLEAVVEHARRIRSHPKDALEDLADQFGMLAPSEELLLLALRSAGDTAVEGSLLELDAGLAHGLRMMRATESLRTGEMSYDGRVGRIEDLGRLGVTSLEMLGGCPLKFFFRERLQIADLDEEMGPFELAAREMGIRIHDLLELVYRALDEEGRFPAADLGVLKERALELVAEKWPQAMGTLAERFLRRAPLLWSIEEARWRGAVRQFLSEDLERFVSRGWKPEGFENRVDQPLAAGPGVQVVLRGRFDRVVAGEDGRVVGDYKTSGNLKRRGSIASMLKGHCLQVPLYRRLIGDEGAVELLGVGPEFAEGGKRTADDERRVEFRGFPKDGQQASFDDSIRALIATAAAGIFPLRYDAQACSWCAYRRACRRNHPPSRHREDSSRDAAGYHRVQKKSTRALDPPMDDA